MVSAVQRSVRGADKRTAAPRSSGITEMLLEPTSWTISERTESGVARVRGKRRTEREGHRPVAEATGGALGVRAASMTKCPERHDAAKHHYSVNSEGRRRTPKKRV
jgi:hypothetical protein